MIFVLAFPNVPNVMIARLTSNVIVEVCPDAAAKQMHTLLHNLSSLSKILNFTGLFGYICTLLELQMDKLAQRLLLCRHKTTLYSLTHIPLSRKVILTHSLA